MNHPTIRSSEAEQAHGSDQFGCRGLPLWSWAVLGLPRTAHGRPRFGGRGVPPQRSMPDARGGEGWLGYSLRAGGVPEARACERAESRSCSAQMTLPPDSEREPHLRDSWVTRKRPRPFSSVARA